MRRSGRAPRFVSRRRRPRHNRLRLHALPHTALRLGILDVPGHCVDQRLERVGAAGVEEAAAIAVGVDVDDGLLAQLRFVMLDPLGRSEQALLFTVPGGIDDRPLRSPALLYELPERTSFLELRGHPACRILCAVHPGVVVVAADDPLVGVGRSRQARDDVVDALETPIEGQLQVHARRTGSCAVGDRQPAAPVDRDGIALEGRQKRLRVAVGDRQDRYPRERRELFHVEACRPRGRPAAWRRRIAGIGRHVHHAAPLDAVLAPHRAVREDTFDEVAVIARVRVQQAANGPPLGRHFRLDAPPRRSVACDHDRALDRDAAPVELFVVGGQTVIHVDERPRDIAIDRVRIERGKLLCLLRRCGIDIDWRLFERQPEPGRLRPSRPAAPSVWEKARRSSRSGLPSPTP